MNAGNALGRPATVGGGAAWRTALRTPDRSTVALNGWPATGSAQGGPHMQFLTLTWLAHLDRELVAG